MTEQELISEAKNGNIEAFEEIVKIYEKKIFNIIFRMNNNIEDAKEITQEVFIKIFRYIKNFEGKSAFSTWVYRIAMNTSIDEVKKRNKVKTISINESAEENKTEIQIEDDRPSPMDVVEQKEFQKIINNAMEKLSKEHKEILILRDINSFEYKEISEILDLGEGTVKSRISRARKSLKKILLTMEQFKDIYSLKK